MDVPRAGVAKKKRQKRIIMIGGIVLALIAATIGLSRLKPAVPSIDRSTVWIDTVKQGPMVRQVRGLGVLVPEEIRWIAARTEARVDKIVVRPGAQVEPDTLLLELTSPEVEQAARDAVSQYTAQEAELSTLRASLQRELLEQEANAARVRSEFQQAKMENETNNNLSKNGLVSDLVHKTSKIKADDLGIRDGIEQKRPRLCAAEHRAADRRETGGSGAVPRECLAQERADGAAESARRFHGRAAAAAGGSWPARHARAPNLARVADPTPPESGDQDCRKTQAKDIQIGLPATIDTRNGVVAGSVARVDPAVEQGTVRVDVSARR
jgi:HlyD family secretion protein